MQGFVFQRAGRKPTNGSSPPVCTVWDAEVIRGCIIFISAEYMYIRPSNHPMQLLHMLRFTHNQAMYKSIPSKEDECSFGRQWCLWLASPIAIVIFGTSAVLCINYCPFMPCIASCCCSPGCCPWPGSKAEKPVTSPNCAISHSSVIGICHRSCGTKGC